MQGPNHLSTTMSHQKVNLLNDATQHTQHLLMKTSTPRGLSSTLPNRHDQSYKTWQGLPVDVQRVRRRDNTRHPLGGPGEPLNTVAAPPNTETTMEGTKPPSPSMCFNFHHTPTVMFSKCMATVKLQSFRRQKPPQRAFLPPNILSVPKPLVNTQENVNPTLSLKNSHDLLHIVCINPQWCYSKRSINSNVNRFQP